MPLFESSEDEFLKEVPQKYLLAWLCTKLSLTPIRVQEILTIYDDDLVEAISDNFNQFSREKFKWLQKWKGKGVLESLESFLKDLSENEIEVVSSLDSNYPKRLKDLDKYPIVLYYQGDLEALERNKKQLITVVGSRNYTKYAEILMNKILKPACLAGVGVVSGLALGIDGISHKIALEEGSFTVGVIGSGLDDKSFYPYSNLYIKKKVIESGGLVMSEYPPGTKPTAYSFPERNRILAALSDLTWVVQAAEKSGSLITSSIARDLGKTVATTPGSVFETTLKGNIKLIKDGANLITEVDDIFQILGLVCHSSEINFGSKPDFSSEKEEEIYNCLSLTPKLVENIAKEVEFDVVEVSGILTMLELSGLAVSVGENRWVRGG